MCQFEDLKMRFLDTMKITQPIIMQLDGFCR